MEAGIVIVTEFVSPGSGYSSYIDYMDNDGKTPESGYGSSIDYMEYDGRATKAQYEGEERRGYSDYVFGYMANPAKATALFTKDQDYLTQSDKAQIKNIYDEAEKNGSIMWKTVITFDNEFLTEYGLRDDEKLLKECTRKAMHSLLKKEGLLGSSTWCADVHVNTDNLHVHLSTVEGCPSWEAGKGRCRERNGELYQRGKFKLSSIKAAKSSFFAEADKHSGVTTRIGEIRDRLYGLRRDQGSTLNKEFVDLANSLPHNMRLWKYGMTAMVQYRDRIDKFTTGFIKENCAEEFDEYLKLIAQKQEQYSKVYGDTGIDYSENKVTDLYQRLGNILLREMIGFEKQRRNWMRTAVKKTDNTPDIFGKISEVSTTINAASRSMRKMQHLFRRSISEMKNQAAYERMRATQDEMARG